MAIGFCPHCKHTVRLGDEVKIGKQVSCWYCGAKLKVSAPHQKKKPAKQKVVRIWRKRTY